MAVCKCEGAGSCEVTKKMLELFKLSSLYDWFGMLVPTTTREQRIADGVMCTKRKDLALLTNSLTDSLMQSIELRLKTLYFRKTSPEKQFPTVPNGTGR